MVYRVLGVLATAALALAVVAHGESAFAAPDLETTPRLLLTLPFDVTTGERFNVDARLNTSDGNPIPRAEIEFQLQGRGIGAAVTDGQGVAARTVTEDLAAGKYTIGAAFSGDASEGIAAATAEATLDIAPAAATIQAVPAIAGLQVRVGNEVFTSDAAGTIRIEVDMPGDYHLELLPWSSPDPHVRGEFVKWGDETVLTQRSLQIPSSRVLYAGFELSYLFGVEFMDLEEQNVGWSEVDSTVVRGNNNAELQFASSEKQWLLANRLLRQGAALFPTSIQYAVKSVLMAGAQVVNSQQQRFYPTPGGAFQVQVLMYDAHIRVSDALFRSAAGTRVTLEFPDGRTVDYPIGNDGALTIPRLPRGDYKIRVDGGALSFTRPLSMSRDQDVDLEVITYLDVLAVGGGLAFLLVGALLIGHTAIVRAPWAALRSDQADGYAPEPARRSYDVLVSSPQGRRASVPLIATPAACPPGQSDERVLPAAGETAATLALVYRLLRDELLKLQDNSPPARGGFGPAVHHVPDDRSRLGIS